MVETTSNVNMMSHEGMGPGDEIRQFSRESEFDKNRSPFRPPNDEEVFVTRETEKQKRKEAKEQAKNLKIWDKNTATSRAPLRRVRDRDISPAEEEEKLFSFNSK